MENVGEGWHAALSQRIGQAVASRRKALDMTAQQLAERCKDLGVPIHRTTITKIENGRSRFDLGELIVLAVALNTSPVGLVYPGPYEGLVDITPSVRVTEFQAAQWFSGLRPALEDDTNASDAARLRAGYRKSMETLAVLRTIDELQARKAKVVPTGKELTDEQRAENAFLDRQIDRWLASLGEDNA
ncbi:MULTISPECIES: helix-turn-helix domain-containing protein [unclassified Mycobacterium]|uniref:helix-turn-helix domain-containing protein n=1 Tax=unclassified Mycobacterium TaxID=2642494 RepID=UPI0009EE1C58|nr:MULTISPECIES: helix-turn-helix transcriptional regulator [unclassified Mycobacterium]